jgi:hypothetical protein
MSKKCFEDLIFFQNRLSRNNKKKFRDFVFERAGGLGLRSENYPRFKGQKNILIGDIRKAKYIIATYYDTPVKMPAFITRKAPLSNLLLSAISTILAILLVAIFPKFFYLVFHNNPHIDKKMRFYSSVFLSNHSNKITRIIPLIESVYR